jgi:hypothetical protein
VEHPRAAAIAAAVGQGRVRPPVTPWLDEAPHAPAEVAGVLALQPSGACVFHRTSPLPAAGGCAVHRWRPVSCEHFPQVAVIDPRGVHVTLSHYCPTAAALLFEPGEPAVVAGPPVLADGQRPEGLDARESLPPLRRPGPGRATPQLMSWDEVTAWEHDLVRTVATARQTAAPPEMALFEHARDAVPAGLDWPAAPVALEDVWRTQVADRWVHFAPVVGRYLASKAHASWALYLGAGTDEVVRQVAIARAVLQVESARACVSAHRRLDADTLRHAIRQSDLLLLHHADPGILAGGARI